MNKSWTLAKSWLLTRSSVIGTEPMETITWSVVSGGLSAQTSKTLHPTGPRLRSFFVYHKINRMDSLQLAIPDARSPELNQWQQVRTTHHMLCVTRQIHFSQEWTSDLFTNEGSTASIAQSKRDKMNSLSWQVEVHWNEKKNSKQYGPRSQQHYIRATESLRNGWQSTVVGLTIMQTYSCESQSDLAGLLSWWSLKALDGKSLENFVPCLGSGSSPAAPHHVKLHRKASRK